MSHYIKPKKRKARLESRIKDYERSPAGKESGHLYNKPGSTRR